MVELAIGFLGAWALKKALGPIDRDVDDKLDSWYSRVKRVLSRRPEASAALDDFESAPHDARVRERLRAEFALVADQDPELRNDFAGFLQNVDVEVQAAWMAADTGIDLATVNRVLAVWHEYQEAVGITEGAIDNFVYYRPAEVEANTNEAGEIVVDDLKVATDAAQFLGIPLATAADVLDAEVRYLQLRGIAGDELAPAA